MYILHHFALCPFSRKIRILLGEKNIDFSLVAENYWERKDELAKLNPAMQVPILVIKNDNNDNDEAEEIVIPDNYAITEYIEEKLFDETRVLLGTDPKEKAKIRRLISWFDHKFYNEVSRYIINEKVIRYYTGVGQPLSDAIRAAKANLIPHLEYIAFLTKDTKWLAGDNLSLADITAAAHLSVLDYLNEINWDNYQEVKDWYALIKSRPSFRGLLGDRMPGFHPPKCYANLDF